MLDMSCSPYGQNSAAEDGAAVALSLLRSTSSSSTTATLMMVAVNETLTAKGIHAEGFPKLDRSKRKGQNAEQQSHALFKT